MKKSNILRGIAGAIFVFVMSLVFAQPTELSTKLKVGGAILCTAGIAASIKKENGEEFNEQEKELLGGVQKLLDKHAGSGLTEEKATELINKALEGYSPEIKGMVTEETFKELQDAMTKQGEQITKMSLAGQVNEQTIKGIMARLSEQIDTEEFKEQLLNFKGSSKSSGQATKDPLTLIHKAPLNAFNPSANEFFSESEDTTFVYEARETVRMSDYVNMIPSDGKVSHTYTQEVSTNGEAAVVDCGELKPLVSATYERKTVEPFKIAAHVKECDDLLIYIPKLKAALQNLLMRKLADARDAEIVNIITAGATSYNLTSLSTTNANEFDAIRAAIAQTRVLNHRPTHVFLNPIDAANFEMTKGADEHYIFVCTCEGGVMRISNLQVVETNQIPQGDFLVADMSLMNVKMITKIIIRMGYGITNDGTDVTDDLVHDILTIVAEQFMTMYIKDLDSNGFVYDSFATVIAAL